MVERSREYLVLVLLGYARARIRTGAHKEKRQLSTHVVGTGGDAKYEDTER
jgi:hypothetical protein